MYTAPAIILSMQNTGEHNQFASLYTQKFGKIRVIVKSARKLSTKQGNFLHPVGIYECSFISGRAGYILGGIVSKKHYPAINSNLFGLGYLTSFLKLVDNVIYGTQQDKSLWKLLTHALDEAEEIVKQNVAIQAKLWQKEKLWAVDLLNILGLKPQKLDLDKIRSQRELDIYLKKILESRLEQPVSLFGL